MRTRTSRSFGEISPSNRAWATSNSKTVRVASGDSSQRCPPSPLPPLLRPTSRRRTIDRHRHTLPHTDFTSRQLAVGQGHRNRATQQCKIIHWLRSHKKNFRRNTDCHALLYHRRNDKPQTVTMNHQHVLTRIAKIRSTRRRPRLQSCRIRGIRGFERSSCSPITGERHPKITACRLQSTSVKIDEIK